MYALNNNITCFDSFDVEHIPEKIEKSNKGSLINKSAIKGPSITRNIYRIQADYSVMCGYLCTEFNDFMIKGKSLTAFTNLFSPNNNKKMMI